MTEWADKIRSIATPRRWGSKKRTEVTNEDTGQRAGEHVEHWDDRVDAVVELQTVQAKPRIQED